MTRFQCADACADLERMIAWSAEYDTGVAVVDDDHRKLVKGLNDLETALANGSGSAVISTILEFLESYSAAHFAREEGCMLRHACPTAAANKAAHQEFIGKLAAAKVRLAASKGSGALVAVNVHRELCDWFVTHVLRIDSALKQCRPFQAPAASGRH